MGGHLGGTGGFIPFKNEKIHCPDQQTIKAVEAQVESFIGQIIHISSNFYDGRRSKPLLNFLNSGNEIFGGQSQESFCGKRC